MLSSPLLPIFLYIICLGKKTIVFVFSYCLSMHKLPMQSQAVQHESHRHGNLPTHSTTSAFTTVTVKSKLDPVSSYQSTRHAMKVTRRCPEPTKCIAAALLANLEQFIHHLAILLLPSCQSLAVSPPPDLPRLSQSQCLQSSGSRPALLLQYCCSSAHGVPLRQESLALTLCSLPPEKINAQWPSDIEKCDPTAALPEQLSCRSGQVL